MQRFPDHISFIHPWRNYQRRVLEHPDRHLENRHLHLVAPPGSGKTVLGLEVMLSINKPTIILTPTLTNGFNASWNFFLQTNEKPDWVSTDLKQPAFVTITTYQALHSLFKTEKETEEADAAEEMETGAEGGGEGWEEVSSAPEARFIREKMESIGCG
jgi:superfamily II DNA or RNA helicase